jgi:hypothetical protein
MVFRNRVQKPFWPGLLVVISVCATTPELPKLIFAVIEGPDQVLLGHLILVRAADNLCPHRDCATARAIPLGLVVRGVDAPDHRTSVVAKGVVKGLAE